MSSAGQEQGGGAQSGSMLAPADVPPKHNSSRLTTQAMTGRTTAQILPAGRGSQNTNRDKLVNAIRNVNAEPGRTQT